MHFPYDTDWYTERVVTYVYPKDHETMSGKCVMKDGSHECIRAMGEIYKRYIDLRSWQMERRREREYEQYYEEENAKSNCGLDDVAKRCDEEYETMSHHTAGYKMYKIEKYSKNHKAKKLYPQKKRLRRELRKFGVKGGAKRIENKMKKYKNRYEYLAY